MIMLILSGGRFHFFPYCFIRFNIFSLALFFFFGVVVGLVWFGFGRGPGEVLNLRLCLMLRPSSGVFIEKQIRKRVPQISLLTV